MSDILVPFTEVRRSFAEPKPAWGIDKGSGEVFIRCGGCGQCLNLDHEILSDGTVRPSVHHDNPDCGWHVFVTLEGYTEHKEPRTAEERKGP
jgi:hypothetical protein